MRWMHLWIWSCSLGLLACSPSVASPRRPTEAEPRAAASTSGTTLESLPWDQRLSLERAMAEDDPRHAPTSDDGRPGLTAGGVRATFGDAAELRIGEHTAHLRAVSLGRGASRTPLTGTSTHIQGAEVRAERAPGIVEWWRSIASGLEHGVTIAERPAGEGELTLELEVTGLGVRSVSDDAVELTDASGSVVAAYAHLVVTAANGAHVAARMAAHDGSITIAVDDARAEYPLVVDPVVVALEASLLDASPAPTNEFFGTSVAFAGDGSRFIVGAPDEDVRGALDAGRVRVFRLMGGLAREAVLDPPDTSIPAFGRAVALTTDGSRAVVGASGGSTSSTRSAAYVFVRSGTAWTLEATLTATDGELGDYFGNSVSITGDGSRVLVGVPYDDRGPGGNVGSARVFVRTGTTWAEEATLAAPDGAINDQAGWSVSIASDGTRAVVGAPLDDTAGGTDAGSANVFVRSGGVWTHESLLVAPDGAAGDGLGESVALTSDGSRAVVGGRLDDTPGGTEAGGARVFVRTGTAWAQEAALLPGTAFDRAGRSVAIAADGSRAFVGIEEEDTPTVNAGAVAVYVRSASTWTLERTLTVTDGATSDLLGRAVATTANGGVVVAGAIRDDTTLGIDSGSVRRFSRTGTTWTEGATVLGADGNAQERFGAAVALTEDGSRALVGAWTADGSAPDGGNARVFVRVGAGWAEEATLVPSDGAGVDGFGSIVALAADGSRAVIGAPTKDTASGVDAGAAYVFVRVGSTWTEEAILHAADATAGDSFGFSVAMSADGSTAAVGAWRDDTAQGTDAGSVTVFERSGSVWVEGATLTASDGAASDQFGVSLAMTGDSSRVVVGASGDNVTATSQGTARVFVRSGSGWSEEATLLASDAAFQDFLGGSVAIDEAGDLALVGAWRDADDLGVTMGSARVFVRTGTTWTEQATLLPSDGAAGDAFGWSVALSRDGARALVAAERHDTAGATDSGAAYLFLRTDTTWDASIAVVPPSPSTSDYLGAVALSGDGSRALVGIEGDDTAGGTDAGSALVFTLRGTNGTPCGAGAGCGSGFCVDGVCCNTACGDGALDCQACSVAAGAGVDGTCGALRTDAMVVTCRPSTDLCDAPEVCTPASTACPPDVLHGSGHECRGAAGGCDAPEVCDGASAACPADVIRGSGEICRTLAGICDQAELCDGVSVDCPGDAFVPASTVCRASVGGCDVAEACDGATANCPGDTWLPAGTVCGVGMGTCAMPSVCSGVGVLCGSASGVRPAGTVCRTMAGECDVEDVCDGSSEMCPDAFEPATTTCGDAPSGVCDAQDHCTGTSADCMPTFLAGTECRGSTGGCDPAEVCGGAAADCPPDAISPSGTVCRASSMACDLAESCDGATATCPTDRSTCGDGDVPDGGATDAGTPTPPVEACSCTIAPRTPTSWLTVTLGALLAAALMRRRR